MHDGLREEAAIGHSIVTARRLVNASVSDNTRRAYAGALGQLDAWLDGRQLDDAALAAHGPPRPETMPTAVWINRSPTLTSQVAPATTTVTPVDPQPSSMRPPPRIDNQSPGTFVTSVESLQ